MVWYGYFLESPINTILIHFQLAILKTKATQCLPYNVLSYNHHHWLSYNGGLGMSKCIMGLLTTWSRSSPCDHSGKRPALVMTTSVKPRLICDLNFVTKSSHRWPWPWALLGFPNWTFPLFLSSCKPPLKVFFFKKTTLKWNCTLH